MTRSASLAGVFLLFAVPLALADQPASTGKVSYARDILPLFQQHCIGCHQPAKPQGSYVMTSRDALVKRGEMDLPNVVPGKPLESNLLVKINPTKDGKPPTMPKGAAPLPQKDVSLITRWIAE